MSFPIWTTAFVLAFTFAGVVLFFGDADSRTPLGLAAACLTRTLPRLFGKVITMLGLRWAARLVGRGIHWFFFKPHPIIQLAYVALVVGCYGVFVIHGYPLLPNLYMDGYHRWIGGVVFAACVVTFCMASFMDPGVITPANEARMKEVYPPDNFIYSERKCETCPTTKVARSKHCRVCDRCVARFDHHCIWLNNCVGERNYRWFLAYLACNVILMLYGAAAALSIFASHLTEHRVLERGFVMASTRQRVPASWLLIFQYFMATHTELMMVTFIATVMGVVITGFTGYHLMLTAANTTTNETFKWREAASVRRSFVKQRKAEIQEHAEDMVATGKAPSLGAAKAAMEAQMGPIDPMPDNQYSRGIFVNFADVIWPPSIYGRSAAWLKGFHALPPPEPETDEDVSAGNAAGKSGKGASGSSSGSGADSKGKAGGKGGKPNGDKAPGPADGSSSGKGKEKGKGDKPEASAAAPTGSLAAAAAGIAPAATAAAGGGELRKRK